MIDNRFVCQISIYHFCGDYSCRLSKYCRAYPLEHRKKHYNPVKKTRLEAEEHSKNYVKYNLLFGDLKQKQRLYNSFYYQSHKTTPLPLVVTRDLYYLHCNQDCFNCSFTDCTLPIPYFQKNYYKLWYRRNRQSQLDKKAQYRDLHREELNEKAKEYYSQNRDTILAKQKQYREAHKEYFKKYFQNRGRLYSYKFSRRKNKLICEYPQYECCGYKKCRLYDTCSKLKITNKTYDEIKNN